MADQLDLWQSQAPHSARRDPPTSRVAEAKVNPNTQAVEEVLPYVRRYPGSTYGELAHHYAQDHGASDRWAPMFGRRLADLSRMGLARRCIARRCRIRDSVCCTWLASS